MGKVPTTSIFLRYNFHGLAPPVYALEFRADRRVRCSQVWTELWGLPDGMPTHHERPPPTVMTKRVHERVCSLCCKPQRHPQALLPAAYAIGGADQSAPRQMSSCHHAPNSFQETIAEELRRNASKSHAEVDKVVAMVSRE